MDARIVTDRISRRSKGYVTCFLARVLELMDVLSKALVMSNSVLSN